jgi:uncharacterized protein
MFEWDEEKRIANLALHGLDFADAEVIFDSPYVSIEDTSETYSEQRIKLIGLLRGVAVVFVYTERSNELRAISLRKATKHEARFLYESL